MYKKYCGPGRENLACGQTKVECFSQLEGFCPRAWEGAEVFSLGRTMWMLLEQVTQNEVEGLGEVVVSWSKVAKDIPEGRRGVVDRCLDLDPNGRIGLLALVNFWEGEKCKDWACSVCAPDL